MPNIRNLLLDSSFFYLASTDLSEDITPSEVSALQELEELRRYISIANRPDYALWVKRIGDLVVSLSMLVLLSPVLLIIAATIKLTSTGPVLFSQVRIGKGGKPFRFYKFRSMVANAENLKDSLNNLNEKMGPIFKMRKDPRVTGVGQFLRKYSLDELPQLFNILNNDMSLVGPRPPVPGEVIKYEPWQFRRLSVTPGLTCIWQTSGRSKVSFDEWVKMDLAYIDTWSFWLDIKLLIKTVKTVITADGAY